MAREGQSFAAEREWTVEEIPVLTASVSLPLAPEGAGARAARRIERYYRLQCRAYLRYCERWLFPLAASLYREALASSAPLPCLRAELTYRVTYDEGGLWSLYTQSRETCPGRPALLTRRGDTWDLASGWPAPLSAFFPPRTPWRRRLLALAAEEIRRREAAGVSQYREGWRRALRRRFNSRDFYLTAEGLTFFYPMYALGPASEGICTFVLPYGEGLLFPEKGV